MAKPASSYQTFMAKLGQPEASGLLRAMKLFVRNALAATHLSTDELSEAVQAFFYETEATIAEHPLWADSEPAELERASDSVEKFVMTRLHDRVFAPTPAEVAEDQQLHNWLQRLRFLRIEHLGIPSELHALAPWPSAQQELAKISTYRTPRDKLVCILNCCKRINGSISHSSAGSHGADEFFPVLLYVTLRAAPAGLHASLAYISRFRHPSKLVSESAYYLTHMQSALSFLSHVRAEQLTIEPAVFDRGLTETHAAIEAERAAAAAEAAEARKAEAEAAAAVVAEAEALAAATEAAESAADALSASATGGTSSPAHTPSRQPTRPPTQQQRQQQQQWLSGGTSEHSTPPRATLRSAPLETPQLLATPEARVPLASPAPPTLPGSAWAARSGLPTAASGGTAVSMEMQLVALGENGRGGVGTRVRVELVVSSLVEARRRQIIRELGPPPSLRFLDCRSVSELTMGEVRALFAEYVWLCRALPDTRGT